MTAKAVKHLAVILVMCFLPVGHVQAQLKAFQPGEVIKSSEINGNFEYLEGQIESGGGAASAQCSASQDGSNVVITCSDGTSAVLAGAGTVVTYPEGGLVGASPTQTWSAGDIVFIDGADEVLGVSVYNNLNIPHPQDQTRMIGVGFFNDPQTEKVVVSGSGSSGTKSVYYQTDDCSGQGFSSNSSNASVLEFSGEYLVTDQSFTNQKLLARSYREGGSADWLNKTYDPPDDCRKTEQTLTFMLPVITFVLPPKLANAVYPVRLEQLP